MTKIYLDIINILSHYTIQYQINIFMNTTRIKDLPVANQPIWFKEKRIGYGWTPANKSGWIATLALVSFQVINTIFFVLLLQNSTPNIEPMFIGQFLFTTAAFIGGMITITYLTGTPITRKKFFGNK
jgi:hypothetical protein